MKKLLPAPMPIFTAEGMSGKTAEFGIDDRAD
jgi:hypothetical protein